MPLFKPLFVSTSYVHDSSVDRFSVKGVQFVSVNSMAMEGDGCFLCRDAEARLIKVEYKYDVTRIFYPYTHVRFSPMWTFVTYTNSFITILAIWFL